MKYDAFISYSHSADGRLAPAVHKALHRFAKPWYRLRMLHIFRDQTSLAVTPELWGSIENGLSQSRYFILCGSPESAASSWVHDEIEWWLENRDADTIFLLVTGGDILWNSESGDFDWSRTTALPRRLTGVFSAEPLFIDLRFARKENDLSLRNPLFREAILSLAAPLHNRPKDELGGVDVNEHLRTYRTAVAAVTTLVILFVGALIATWIATEQRDLARSRELAALARNELEIDPAASLRLAIEAMEKRPTIQARQMLRTSLLLSHVRKNLQGHSGEITFFKDIETSGRMVSMGLDGRMFIWNLDEPSVHHELEGYRGDVSMNGEQAVTAIKDHQLAVWDLISGERQATIQGHSSTIFAVAISPDGRLVASGGRDKTVRVHDLETGQMIGDPIMIGRIVTDLVFHPDGQLLVIGSIYNNMVLWDIEAGESYLETSGISATISPDGLLLATGGADNSGGHLIEIKTKTAFGAIGEMTGSIKNIVFSASGKMFAAASSDGTARVWKRNGDLITVLSGHEGPVDDIAFSLNEKFVVTGSRDQTGKVWSVASGREIATLRGHRSGVTVVHFALDGNSILTGAADGSLRVWDAGMASPRDFLPGTHRAVQQLAFTSEGRYVIAASDTGITEVWDRVAGRQVLQIPGYRFAFGENQLAVADNDHTVRLWSMTGSMIAELGQHSNLVSSLVFSKDRQQLLSTSEDGTALLYDVKGTQEPRLITHKAGLSDAAFSPDGSVLITADYKGTARLWSLPTLSEIATLEHSDEIISKVAFTEDGRKVLTASWDGTIGIWETQGGFRLRTLETDIDAVHTFEVLKDKEQLIAGGANGNIELWDIDTGRRLAEFQGHSDGIYNIAVNPLADLAASASNDASARLWDLNTGQEIAAFTVHGDAIWSVAFSPDGKFIVTGSEDGDAHIYECVVCVSDEELIGIANDRIINLSQSWEIQALPE